jgi:hypothetical protein
VNGRRLLCGRPRGNAGDTAHLRASRRFQRLPSGFNLDLEERVTRFTALNVEARDSA